MRDPRVDAYIENAAEFAKPILIFIREAVHEGCPEVTETIKWHVPFFMRKRILCNMAEFKAHCSFGFWQGSKVLGQAEKELEGMGQFGRIASLKDLPGKKQLVAYVREAARLDESGEKPDRGPFVKAKPPLETPADLRAALRKNKKASATFKEFSPSHRREYIEWIVEAKREETRRKRVGQAIEQLAEGKSRHWKYVNC